MSNNPQITIIFCDFAVSDRTGIGDLFLGANNQPGGHSPDPWRASSERSLTSVVRIIRVLLRLR
ncbi:hypothetical protein [Planktothricoides sp. SR001]|uniref:hypothetical protein n=1 Tax=Planktothricoides sp. SR001 TaxID=1705388 RepID=UPI0012E13BC1|nr:hypothetical protein [Planktothricoides sp. SR001]